jgi:L-ribulose-5-phosphate 4-epimerase
VSYQSLKEDVCRVNREIVAAGLVVLTWGNASGVDPDRRVLAIKPSGVDYDALRPEDIVLLSIETGEVVEGDLRPSSDAPTHLHLYRSFPSIGGVVHTHSIYATAWAQAGRALPCLGTTHADHFYGAVPVARQLTQAEIDTEYELNTGVAIVDRFREAGLEPLQMPGVLVPGHAPFVWGKTPAKALEQAVALEAVAKMATLSAHIDPGVAPLPQGLLDKHFLRKHGPGAYYGQTHKEQP